MSIHPNSPVGRIATELPLATRVFARHGIDFCCGGGKPLHEVCEAHRLDTDSILEEIANETTPVEGNPQRWDHAPLDELINHILATYHRPLAEELPRIEEMARKVARVHGHRDPEMFADLVDTFLALKAELEQHMMKEEQILFPMIKQGQGRMTAGPVGVMEAEHESAGAALERLRQLTDGYRVPEEACNTWRALWHGLAALEDSLHVHIHLENNILFPRALAS